MFNFTVNYILNSYLNNNYVTKYFITETHFYHSGLIVNLFGNILFI